jgi:NAD(P)-dependent dehydrogenase (short-subunit alcohol dehydrogenase family)
MQHETNSAGGLTVTEPYLCTALCPHQCRGGGTVQGKAVSTAGKEYTVVDHSTEDYMGILALTQFATFFTCREAAKRMRAQGDGGRIIIIGSVMSNFAAKGSAAYSGEQQSI